MSLWLLHALGVSVAEGAERRAGHPWGFGKLDQGRVGLRVALMAGWWPRSGEDGSSVVPPVFGMGLEWLRAAGAGQAQDRLSPCVGSLSIFIIVIP